MVKRRVYDDEKHVHFVTFSCYKRRKYLSADHAKRIVIGHLGSRLARFHGLCPGFVIMPNHVHVLVWFPETGQFSVFLNKWKDQTSAALKAFFRERLSSYWSQVDDTDSIWQQRYYGFNIWNREKLEEKLEYMHRNPVRAGFVERPTDWPWSSARWYADRKPVGLPIRWPPGLEL